jgi:histidine phosphotransferase ChpT
MTESDDLGALIAQRLCHDLVNPLGAIGNGLELLSMVQQPTPEMALMRDSLDQALGRIKLYRVAFGQAAEGARLSGADLEDCLRGLGGSRPITLSLDLPADLPRADARLVALLGLCAETALAWGGRLEIGLGPQDRPEIALTASAPRLREDEQAWSALDRGELPSAPSPPMVQFALAPAAARAAGRSLAVETGPGRIRVTA